MEADTRRGTINVCLQPDHPQPAHSFDAILWGEIDYNINNRIIEMMVLNATIHFARFRLELV